MRMASWVLGAVQAWYGSHVRASHLQGQAAGRLQRDRSYDGGGELHKGLQLRLQCGG